MNAKPLLIAAVLLPLAACMPHRIPGTDIDDTDDTRQILGLMEKYRAAVESKDTLGSVSRVADTFRDDGGSTTPDDDLDYTTLRTRLPERFAKIDSLKLDINVRRIRVREDKTASAVYNYVASWRMPGLTSRPENASDIKEMSFKQVGGQWKIASGI